jgi:hypothetical protein
MLQVVEHLPSKLKALGSIPNTGVGRQSHTDPKALQFLLGEARNMTAGDRNQRLQKSHRGKTQR